MIEIFPLLLKFNRLYWHQNGTDLYFDIENAFLSYLSDASRLPDGGKAYRNELREELKNILQGTGYRSWFEKAACDSEEIKKAGGNLIPPDALPKLQRIMDSISSES